jgi:glycosyltransferase involved in cell wall biosynthesis
MGLIRSDSPLVSVVIPCYNEEGNIVNLYDILINALPQTCELIFVDDHSTDTSVEKMKELRERDSRVKYIAFSRNFGQQNAILAGLVYAKGDCAISMDVDLQHPPQLVSDMIGKWKEGYDLVITQRDHTEEKNTFRVWTSSLFYFFLNWISDIELKPGYADFRLLDRKVVNVLTSLRDPDIFIRGYVQWMGFRQTILKYKPGPRFSGSSKYTVNKMMRLALSGILSFSVKPIRIAIVMGIFLFMISFAGCLVWMYQMWVNNEPITGVKMMLLVMLLLSSFQFILLGAIGEYVARNFTMLQNRPGFIIESMETD